MSQTSVGVDFTLETVQYKFATIIGELCGKPSVLSQFAVWLDLRLSEYKLKGSISLDCSGLKPDPDWLQGLKDSTPPWTTHPLNSTESDQHVQSRQRRERRWSGQMSSHSTDVGSSSDIVVIKEETHDLDLDFSAGSNQRSNSPSQFRGRIERKRSFHDSNASLSLPGRIELTGVYKNRSGAQHHGRIETTQHSLAKLTASPSKSISHESSIITLQDEISETSFPTQDQCADQTLSSSVLKTSSQNLGPGSAISSYQKGSNSADGSSTGAESTSEACLEESISEPSLEKILNTQSPLPDKQLGVSTEKGVPNTDLSEDSVCRTDTMGGSLSNEHQVTGMNGALQNSWSRRYGVSTLALAYGCSRNTLSNVCASVTSFERWLRENSPDPNQVMETRKMFEIPPPELDVLLVEFFNTVKKPNGEDYNPRSLRSLRTNLARYLKENTYPYSIVTAEVFANSQLAFKNRMRMLESRLSS
ncbi:uncharacterized protein LOC135464079 isoform X1 [Liolophura sinensis]|uniref:uncharacterized protein LOC135464079 isoform X1 n=1 Tax=Liolophura sinensis TaxID=3198878 RepID=UPI0031598A4D